MREFFFIASGDASYWALPGPASLPSALASPAPGQDIPVVVKRAEAEGTQDLVGIATDAGNHRDSTGRQHHLQRFGNGSADQRLAPRSSRF
jgi:hypothetical protein